MDSLTLDPLLMSMIMIIKMMVNLSTKRMVEAMLKASANKSWSTTSSSPPDPLKALNRESNTRVATSRSGTISLARST